MTNYLFEDIFYKFRPFFHTYEYKDSKFLYEIAFGFMPRRFLPTPEDEIIYPEDEEVPEMYFIIEGSVGIGYELMNSQRIGKYLKEFTYICDYYVLNNKRSEFLYKAIREVRAFALQKRFFHDVLDKYPDIAAKLKGESYTRYKKNIREPLVLIFN
jgi:CRP-like cAMP-binding protein